MNRKIYTLIASAVVLLALINVTPGVSAADDVQSLPTALGNGSFENAVISQTDFGVGSSYDSRGKWCLKTSDAFEAWTNWKSEDDQRFYWKTTSLQRYVELGVDDSEFTDINWSYVNGVGGFYAREGTQFAELVADETASLYQNIASSPGEILRWGLSHRSRYGTDIMALFIGPMQDYSYTKATSDGRDIFMWMGMLLNQNGLYSVLNGSNIHECSEPLTVYSKPEINISNVDENNYTEYFSLTKTVDINQQWTCWIIQDTNEAWGDFVGTYEVPEGQDATTFAFSALSSATNYGTYPNEGNLLDAIKFTYAYPLSVASTGGGYGTVTADDADADGNTIENVQVTYNVTHKGNYLAGTGITITATPADASHKFLGANINGVFHEYSETDYFTENNGVYTLNLTIETAEYVQLIFSRQATVIYDPNDGTYNGTEENTEITMSSTDGEDRYTSWTNSENAVSPNEEKIRFIGWYFARGGQQPDGSYTGALIESDHTVNYNTQSTTSTADDTLDVSYTNTNGTTNSSTVSATTGVTFVAQWEYLQKVITMTKQTNEATYKESSVGGSVTMTIEDSDAQSDSDRVVETTDSTAQGFGRLNDIITVTAATASDSYVFMGWYDEDGNVLSHSDTYSYAVADYNTVYAHFSADVVYPYLSFISEKSNPDTTDEVFRNGSHVKVGEEYVWQRNTNVGGEGIYGNTIATGFTLNTKGVMGYSYDHCQWTISIPSGGTYVKVPSENLISDYPFTFEDLPVLEDTEAQVNNGTIWKVNNINTEVSMMSFAGGFDDITDDGSDETLSIFIVNGFDDIESETYEEAEVLEADTSSVILNEITGEVVLRLYDVLPTVITGESVITYGIVIDNLYAPGASAAFELKQANEGADSGFTDISEDVKGEIVHANSAQEYRESENNRYSEVTVEEAE